MYISESRRLRSWRSAVQSQLLQPARQSVLGQDAEPQIGPSGSSTAVWVCVLVSVSVCVSEINALEFSVEVPAISAWTCEWMGECWHAAYSTVIVSRLEKCLMNAVHSTTCVHQRPLHSVHSSAFKSVGFVPTVSEVIIKFCVLTLRSWLVVLTYWTASYWEEFLISCHPLM